MLEDSIGPSIPAHTCPWGRCYLHGAVPLCGSLLLKERHNREISDTAEAKIRPTVRLQRHNRHLEISASLASRTSHYSCRPSTAARLTQNASAM